MLKSSGGTYGLADVVAVVAGCCAVTPLNAPSDLAADDDVIACDGDVTR